MVVKMGNDTIEKIQLLSHFLFEQNRFRGQSRGDTPTRAIRFEWKSSIAAAASPSRCRFSISKRSQAPPGLSLLASASRPTSLVKAVDERGELIIDPFYDGAILTLDEIGFRA